MKSRLFISLAVDQFPFKQTRSCAAMAHYLEAVDIRINQQQVDGDLCRAGICRPDVQATLPGGRRVTIEYDTSASTRGLNHAERTLSNDPNAIVILRTVD